MPTFLFLACVSLNRSVMCAEWFITLHRTFSVKAVLMPVCFVVCCLFIYYAALSERIKMYILRELRYGRPQYGLHRGCPSVIVKRQDRYVNTVRMTHRFISSSRTEDCTFYRAMLCISMVYAGMRCPSVRLSRSWVAPKRIKISSKFFHHPIPNGVALFRREPSP